MLPAAELVERQLCPKTGNTGTNPGGAMRGGTSPGTGRERQASAAVEETSRPEATILMEEVMRRENSD